MTETSKALEERLADHREKEEARRARGKVRQRGVRELARLEKDRTYRAAHPEQAAKRKAYRAAHPEKRRAYHAANADKIRAGYRLKRYGLSQAQFDARLKRQGGVCAICKKADWGPKGPHVDHDEVGGKVRVRGILCHMCNPAIGMLGHDLEILRSAVRYLSRWSGKAKPEGEEERENQPAEPALDEDAVNAALYGGSFRK